jgi:hypothetical protein
VGVGRKAEIYLRLLRWRKSKAFWAIAFVPQFRYITVRFKISLMGRMASERSDTCKSESTISFAPGALVLSPLMEIRVARKNVHHARYRSGFLSINTTSTALRVASVTKLLLKRIISSMRIAPRIGFSVVAGCNIFYFQSSCDNNNIVFFYSTEVPIL